MLGQNHVMNKYNLQSSQQPSEEGIKFLILQTMKPKLREGNQLA